MKRGNRFSSLMMVWAIATILYGVQLLFSMDGLTPGLRHSFWLLIFGPGMYVINAQFLRKERTVTQTVILNGFILVCVLTLLFSRFYTGGGKQVAVTLFYYLFLSYYSVRLNLNEPKENHLILLLDISVVLSIVLSVVMTVAGRTFLYVLPVLAGILFTLLGLMRFRLQSLRLWAVPVVLLFLLILMFGGLMALAKPIGYFLTTVFGGVVSGLRYIGSQFETLLRYLISFMKSDTYEEISSETFGIPSGAMETAQQFQDGMGIIIGLIILGFFIFVLIMALKILGKTGIGGKKIIARKVLAVQTPPFLSAFRYWFTEIKDKLHYSVLVVKHRNTPWGLYYMLRFAAGKSGKKEGETPKQFLLCLSRQLPQTGQQLHSIIPEIDKALFSQNGNNMRVENADGIIRESVKTLWFHKK